MWGSFKFAACGLVACLCLAGCGGRNGLIEISGSITYDGKPIHDGTINFFPADGSGPTAAAIIADGRYSTKVATGQKQVRIEAFKVVGQRRDHPNIPTSPIVDVQEQIIPERYNTKTELTCNITSSVRVFYFPLKK